MSLEGLKSSYQKLSDQNRLVSSEIEGYRSHIQSLQQELDSLESQRIKLSAMFSDQEETGAMFPETVYRQEIEQLTDKIDSSSEKAIAKAFEQKKGELDTALEQSRKSLRAARSDVDKIKEESAGVAAAMAQLKTRQAQLQQQLAERRSGLDPRSVKEYVHWLDKEIAGLRSRERELKKKLSKAPGEESTDISSFTEENYQLRRRFVALYDENMRLKREVFRLGTLAVSPQP